MDPNELLDRLRAAATRVLETGDAADAREVAQGLLDLDDWLRFGGFLPEDWQR